MVTLQNCVCFQTSGTVPHLHLRPLEATMKKTLLLSGLLLALTASVAAAAGLNLGWNLACPTTVQSAGISASA